MNTLIQERLKELERRRRLQYLALCLAQSAGDISSAERIRRRLCATAGAKGELRRMLQIAAA